MKRFTGVFMAAVLCLCMSTTAYAHEYAMSFLYGGTTTQYNNYVANANNVLNSVSPDYFEINSDGSLHYPKLNHEFIAAMHDKGIKVIPFISNHWDRSLGIAALENTEKLTNEIANVIFDYDLDGINVDIENVSHLHRDAYTNFVKTLREKMLDKVVTVSVAANPNNWQTGWHGSYDYEKLAGCSDYLMIMGYDESYYGGPAGPVSSASFAEKSIIYALNYTTPDKIVFGLPFYGRYWKQGEAAGGHGITSIDINNLLENYEASKVYHDGTQSAQVFLTLKQDDVMPKLWGGRVLTQGVYEIWYDDIQATKYKLGLVDKYNLRGSGSWALGQDDKQVWAEYSNYKTAVNPPMPESETGISENDKSSPSSKPAKTAKSEKNEKDKKTITRSWFSEEIIEGNESTTIETIKIKIKSNSDSENKNKTDTENRNNTGNIDRNAGNRTGNQSANNTQNQGRAYSAGATGMTAGNQGYGGAYGAGAGTTGMTAAGNQGAYTGTTGMQSAYGNQSYSGTQATYGNQGYGGAYGTGTRATGMTAGTQGYGGSYGTGTGTTGMTAGTQGYGGAYGAGSMGATGMTAGTQQGYGGTYGTGTGATGMTAGTQGYGGTYGTGTGATGMTAGTQGYGGAYGIGTGATGMTAGTQQGYGGAYGTGTGATGMTAGTQQGYGGTYGTGTGATGMTAGTQDYGGIYNDTNTLNFEGTGNQNVYANQNYDSLQNAGNTSNDAASGNFYGNQSNMVTNGNTQANQENVSNRQGRGSGTNTARGNIVTKGEAVKMIMQLASELPDPEGATTNFIDVQNHSDKDYISKARHYGIVDKTKGNQFYPNRGITKLELIVLIDRVFNLPDTVDFESGRVKDVNKRQNPEAYYAVNKYLEHEIITVDERGNFYPNSVVTTEEMDEIMNKLNGAGIKELNPVLYPGQKQKSKILEPR